MSTLRTNEIKDLEGNTLVKQGEVEKVVDSLVDLSTVPTTAVKSVRVLNFHSDTEGGGGVFYWDATKDKSGHNGGTVIDPDKVGLVTNWSTTQALYFTPEVIGQGCWVRKYDGAVNVKWFGAIGDGVADDTASIKATIDAAIKKEQDVFVSKGDYLISSQIHIDIASKNSLLMTGESGATFSFDFNGVCILSNSSYSNQLRLNNLEFKLLNTETNTNSTCVYFVQPNNGWGAGINVKNCAFNNFTNCAIHGIRAFNSIFENLVIIGNSSYNKTTATRFSSDAGIRLWGADGTLTEQDHSFSNLNRIQNCLITRFSLGIDFQGGQCDVVDSTFEALFAGIIVETNQTDVSGYASSTEKSGYYYSDVAIKKSWFEQISSQYIARQAIADDGSLVTPSGGKYGIVKTGYEDNYYNVSTTEYMSDFKIYKPKHSYLGNRGGVSLKTSHPDEPVLYAFSNNPDEEFFKVTPTKTDLRTHVTVHDGLQFGASGSKLNTYQTGTFSPVIYIGETAQTAAATPWCRYTLIGNVLTLNFSFYKEGFSKTGTGNVTIRNLPFSINSNSKTSVPVDEFYMYAGSSVPHARARTDRVELVKKTTTGSTNSVITDADIASPAGVFLLAFSLTVII
jgi:hypothetical protein